MRIVEITAGASRTIPHPRVKYAMAKPMVSYKAELADSDDVDEVTVQLQKKAEKFIEIHVERLYEFWSSQ